jgi:hypothetical protein
LNSKLLKSLGEIGKAAKKSVLDKYNRSIFSGASMGKIFDRRTGV